MGLSFSAATNRRGAVYIGSRVKISFRNAFNSELKALLETYGTHDFAYVSLITTPSR